MSKRKIKSKNRGSRGGYQAPPIKYPEIKYELIVVNGLSDIEPIHFFMDNDDMDNFGTFGFGEDEDDEIDFDDLDCMDDVVYHEVNISLENKQILKTRQYCDLLLLVADAVDILIRYIIKNGGGGKSFTCLTYDFGQRVVSYKDIMCVDYSDANIVPEIFEECCKELFGYVAENVNLIPDLYLPNMKFELVKVVE